MKEVFLFYITMVQNVIEGVKAYFEAFKIINELKLWKYFRIPIIISLIVGLVIGGSALLFAGNIGTYMGSIWRWDFGKDTFNAIATFISGLLILAVGFILYKHIVMALVAPFMSPISEKIEKHFLGNQHNHRVTTFSEQLSRGIKISVRNLGRELMFTIPVLILGFIPILGLISPIILFLIQAYYAGFGNIDFTLERHYKYKESIQFVRKNRGLAIGNGILFILLLLIPVIGFIIVLPLSVTAATSETIKKIT